MTQKYVNFSHLIDFLKSLSLNRDVNKDPYMDNALLNMRQILELDIHNPCLFHYIEVGGCDDCRWRNRTQKCACCRRNLHIKDCYEMDANSCQMHETVKDSAAYLCGRIDGKKEAMHGKAYRCPVCDGKGIVYGPEFEELEALKDGSTTD